MRSVLIVSVAGELRHITVSGLAEIRLHWLFRNFCILDFPVLNKKQQQLIARAWHGAPSATSADDAPLDLIGTIERFAPRLYPPTVPTASSTPCRTRSGLSRGLRIPVIVSTVAVLLMGYAIFLGQKHRLMPQSHVAAVAATNPVAPTNAAVATNRVSSTVTSPARTPAETAPPVADVPAAAIQASNFHPLPGAMASNAPSMEVKPPELPVAVSTKALVKPEVVIRVSVDRQGRAQAFHVLRGNEKKKSAALNAAKHWSFEPCPGSTDCEHLLKFTDYGDASVVQMIE
jgi:hypothetical protein